MPAEVPLFSATKPCGNCPYRKDAPRALWAREEYEKLLSYEAAPLGAVYKCHKNNGSVCVGWLMKQDEQYFPSVALRLAFLKHKIDRSYLDQLQSPAPLFKTVAEMIKYNFPDLIKKKP